MGNELRKPINAVNEMINNRRHDNRRTYETANATTSTTPTLDKMPVIEPTASYAAGSGTATVSNNQKVGFDFWHRSTMIMILTK